MFTGTARLAVRDVDVTNVSLFGYQLTFKMYDLGRRLPASHVPKPEVRVARKSWRKLATRPTRSSLPATMATPNYRRLAVASTRPSASPKRAFSPAVPTVTRIAPGAPKPPAGRTITPSRRSASNKGLASSATSAE